MKLVWKSGAEGARAVPGALVRWRDVRRGAWQYAYYRGPQGRLLTFSLTPDGPIMLWKAFIGIDAEMAVVLVSTTGSDQ